ncbi:MAG TPA: hypothetical protein VD948_00270 [Rhodothermales bacterium]|nr:hypothetical protein [Rhodothermales bacterium]
MRAALLLAFTLAGCQLLDLSRDQPEPSSPLPARLDSTFELQEGQSATLDGSDYQLSFVSVTQDSRCPADAMCVWQGEALVVVGPSHPAIRFRPDTLTSAPRSGTPRTDSLRVGPYVVRLKELHPYPLASQPRREPYRALFTLARAGS